MYSAKVNARATAPRAFACHSGGAQPAGVGAETTRALTMPEKFFQRFNPSRPKGRRIDISVTLGLRHAKAGCA